MHRLRAIADEGGEVVDVERVARLRDQAHPGPQARLDQVLPHRADGQEHGDRRSALAGGAIADDEDVGSPPRGALGRTAQGGEGGLEAGGSLGGIPERVESDGGEPGDIPKRAHLLRQQHRVLQTQHPGIRGALQQGRAAPAQVHAERHHHRLAQRIDRRVGHLREPLPEIGVQALGHRGERWDRSVVAHAPHRVAAGASHRLQHQPQIFRAVAEDPLEPEQIVAGVRGRNSGRVGSQRRHVARYPPRVRAACRYLALRLDVADHLAPPGVHYQHLARTDLAALHHLSRIEVHQTDLGAGHHQPVAPHLVAAGAQPIAIHGGAGQHPISESERGGAVPRLQDALVVFVERLHAGIEVGILLPRLGDRHHRGVHHIAAGLDQELHGVVEAGRVAPFLPDDLLQSLDLRPKQRRRQHRLPHRHRVPVAPQRVDLSVVGQQAERLRQGPAWQRVGRVALVEDRDGALVFRIAKVGVERRELSSGQQRLVHDGATGQRADVEAGQRGLLGSPLHLPPRQIQGALPGVLIGGERRPAHQHLSDDRTRAPGRGAQRRRIHRHLAPAQHRDAVFREHRLDHGDGRGQRLCGRGQEEGADAEGKSRLKVESQPIGIAEEEPLRYLGQQPGAIAGEVGGRGTAVRHARRGLDGHGDDFMGAPSGGIGDEADAAGIVLSGGIEGGCCCCCGVSPVVLAGTGRVDPLPIGGHGVS